MNCYACMLGDDDRRTLYLVTAPTATTPWRGRPATAPREGADDRARAPACPERAAASAQLGQRAAQVAHGLADALLVLDEGEADVAVAAGAEADAG